MQSFTGDISAVVQWLAGHAREVTTLTPQRRGAQGFAFEPIGEGPWEFHLGAYRPTISPPGRALLPANDVLFTFVKAADGSTKIREHRDESERLIAGVRPCDLRSIHLMDKVMADGVPDQPYLTRRQHTSIVGVACNSPCDASAFCDAAGALDHRDGADVFITALDEQRVLLEPLTAAGGKLLATGQFAVCDDPTPLLEAVWAARPKPFGRQLDATPAAIAETLHDVWESDVWGKHAERCFSCGTCNTVCPTCYCFEVTDDLNVDAESGFRTRSPDACTLPAFAEVAGGHNFRASAAERQRHRVKRKFEYLPDKFDMGSFCVGCGRCGRECTTNIDIFDIVNDISRAHAAPSEDAS